MKFIDNILDRITMYRLVVYVLGGYVGAAILLAFTGSIQVSPTALILSLGLILVPAYIADKGFARLFHVPTNSESWLITALILFLILPPVDSTLAGVALVLAGAVSSASKFLVTWHAKHIFNPAAFAAALVSLTGLMPTTWWIGSSMFWPLTLVLGLAVVRKIRHIPLVVSFVATSLLVQVILFQMHHQPIMGAMKSVLVVSPLIFLATIMLTEPATMPPRRRQQVIFAMLAAVLYTTGWRIGPLNVYPEVALLIANLYAFSVSPKYRIRMRLQEIQRISDRVYTYVFKPERPFAFLPGQYMDFTLANVPYDSRGNRRSFTLASAPGEDTVQVGVKFYRPASAYKTALRAMKPGDMIHASQLAGDFTLDQAAQNKVVFIAGGIGITPFRSMVKAMVDQRTSRDVVLLYLVSDPTEFAYIRLFIEAKRYGVRLIPIVTNPDKSIDGALTARLNQALLERLVPDASERTFYISGPSQMVDAAKGYLQAMHITRDNIITDHFSGY